MRICSQLLKKFLTEKFIFLHWFVPVNRQKNTAKKKITYFLKKHVTSLFTFLQKVFAICKFFTLVFYGPFLFYLFEVQSTVLYLLRREKIIDLVVIFKGTIFCRIFTKSQKSCSHKIFNIGSSTKVNCHEFYFFILNMQCTKLQYC